MLKEVFETKAKQMGDFYLYYKKAGAIHYAVATKDLSNPYIANKAKFRSMSCSDDEVIVFNYRYDNFLKVPYSNIKKLTPLASVLKNGD